MAVAGLDNMTALARHHVPGMAITHKRALVLRNDGRTDSGSADVEGVSTGTMRQRIGIASAEIALCLPEGMKLTGEMRGAWTQAHLECCLGDAVAELRGVA